MGVHSLNAFDNQRLNITLLAGTKVFNSYLKVFNMGVQFLKQITKDSLTKNKSYAFDTNISSQSEFRSLSDWFFEITDKVHSRNFHSRC